MKKYLIIFICLWGGVGFSCSNWLDVKPSDRISEDNNFSSLVGFKKTLNGVYIELNSSDLYGKNLSCEFIEILAQRYAIGDENKSNKELMEFSYNGSAGRGKTTSIWGTAYKLIANTNLILKNIELHSDVLAGEYYNLIKGEALALRALLHFDLFRLFGPIYTEDSTAISIPYYKEFQFDAAPSYAANVSPQKKGAQAAENIMHCNYEYFCELQKAANDLIKIVDIAPEEPGAMNFIDKVKDNVVVSIAHTAADYDTAMEAIQHGVTHATHLYNAMPPMNHRKPGVIGAVRDSYQCHAELICDGVHIHPSVIRATFAMLGAGRIILISDSMRATGLEDGEYTLGGQPVVVKGNLATLHDGTIAGSATNLMDCLRYVVKKAGISLETAVMCATENPAKEIGIYDKVGSISVGKQADFVLIDEELNIKRVYIDGKEIIC